MKYRINKTYKTDPPHIQVSVGKCSFGSQKSTSARALGHGTGNSSYYFSCLVVGIKTPSTHISGGGLEWGH